MTDKQAILHELEELGQARPEALSEVFVVATRTGLKALGASLLWGSAITGGRWLFGDDLVILNVAITYGSAWAIAFGLSIGDDLDEHQEGLRAQKSAVSYAPPQPEPAPEPQKPWRPPIPVFSQGDVQLVDVNERPAIAPPEQPALTAAAVLEILGASLENNGSFSRRTITRLKLTSGQKVTRGMWQEAAGWLHQVGILRRDPQGAYRLPPEIQSMDDLYIQLPGLRQLTGRRAGLDRQRTGPDTGYKKRLPGPTGRAPTLAEQRRQRWIECGCDAKRYLGGGQ